MELARLRLRGVYAALAGMMLLFAAPLVQALALGDAYTVAIAPIAHSRDFQPYLAWLSGHLGADQALRVIQAAPLLIALALPGPLSVWLWPERSRPRLVALIAGWLGFGAFVLAGVIGLVASAGAASAFQAATSAPAQTAVATHFAQQYALQSLLSRTVGGAALALFLTLISLRFIRATRLPRWAAYLGELVAALQAANAVIFLLDPLNIQAPTASLSLAGLAVWLLVIGVALWQTTQRAAPSEEAPIEPALDSQDAHSGAPGSGNAP